MLRRVGHGAVALLLLFVIGCGGLVHPVAGQPENACVLQIGIFGGAFASLTARHLGHSLAVLFDNVLLTAPSANEPVASGRTEIAAFRALAETYRVAEVPDAGSLGVRLKTVAVRRV